MPKTFVNPDKHTRFLNIYLKKMRQIFNFPAKFQTSTRGRPSVGKTPKEEPSRRSSSRAKKSTARKQQWEEDKQEEEEEEQVKRII